MRDSYLLLPADCVLIMCVKISNGPCTIDPHISEHIISENLIIRTCLCIILFMIYFNDIHGLSEIIVHIQTYD